jgi:dTDP-4-dehydrorhamnose reductase
MIILLLLYQIQSFIVMSSKRVLICGVDSLLGNSIAHAFAADDHQWQVHALGTIVKPSSRPCWNNSGVIVRHVNLNDTVQVQRIFDEFRPHIVIHW